MLIYSELIERAVKGRSMDEYLGQIRAAAERGAELTGQLRQVAHRPSVTRGSPRAPPSPPPLASTRTC